ncbi:MAG: polymer-forming cytoskeletal protein [Verrucomicrobia bacterium]|nr:polymer-forming cytoskeletal protein [Verrucomicrobiota bacterium]
MAKKTSQTPVIDGFRSVQAVKRAGGGSQEAKTRAPSTRLPEKKRIDKPSDASSAKTRIGHTAMPARHELTCYECGFEFILTGRLDDTFCSKCRKALKATNHVIAGEWSHDIRTLGTIEVRPEAQVAAVNLMCGNLLLDGDVEACDVTVCRTATFRKAAKFDLDKMRLTDVVVSEASRLSIRRLFECRHLELCGAMNTRLHAQGRVTLKAGSTFKGELHAATLDVQEGAALKANLCIGPAPHPPKA